MLVALKPLHDKYKIKRVVVSTYQSVTGTGVKAVQQLNDERAGIEGEKAYPYQIDLNVIPHIDVFQDNGYTKEEMKMIKETNKIMQDDSIKVTKQLRSYTDLLERCIRIAKLNFKKEIEIVFDCEKRPVMLFADEAHLKNVCSNLLDNAIKYSGEKKVSLEMGMDPENDSYSGFFDNGRRKNTGLAGYLRDRNIEEVHVCGLAADYCVYFTAKDALSLGFKTAILTDATKAIDPAQFEKLARSFEEDGGKLI
ncbi:hypothetical protein FQR65_LT16651 [Abscondita terminalis]|nr:hypothetical protein FQR65_LT16651 [Abscondita terminalis]